jgi:hypothetical protein
MEYNTTRDSMIISEYGRNIQKMVRHIAELEDPEKRSRMARTLVSILASMHPDTRDQVDLKHKYWDHLHVMSDFTLEVDSPFPVPPRPLDTPPPNTVPYTQENIKLRPYGKYMQRIIEKACEFEEGPEKDALVMTIANNLKKMYLNWNRDTVNDELIHDHLGLLSTGKLKLKEEDKLHSTTDLLKANKLAPSDQRPVRQGGGQNIPRKRFKKDNNRRRKY